MPDNVKNSHNGGPSVRKGQIDWVPAIKNVGELRLWLIKMSAGTRIFLSKEVYPDEEERRWAFKYACIHAASIGHFDEMVLYIELLDADEITCEKLLKKIEEKFLPAQDIERKKSSAAFMAYTRRGKSLSEAVKELKVLVLECKKLGYSPDKETLITKYESLLASQELPLYRIYLKQDDSDD